MESHVIFSFLFPFPSLWTYPGGSSFPLPYGVRVRRWDVARPRTRPHGGGSARSPRARRRQGGEELTYALAHAAAGRGSLGCFFLDFGNSNESLLLPQWRQAPSPLLILLTRACGIRPVKDVPIRLLCLGQSEPGSCAYCITYIRIGDVLTPENTSNQTTLVLSAFHPAPAHPRNRQQMSKTVLAGLLGTYSAVFFFQGRARLVSFPVNLIFSLPIRVSE